MLARRFHIYFKVYYCAGVCICSSWFFKRAKACSRISEQQDGAKSTGMNYWLYEGIDAVQQTYTQHNHSRKREGAGIRLLFYCDCTVRLISASVDGSFSAAKQSFSRMALTLQYLLSTNFSPGKTDTCYSHDSVCGMTLRKEDMPWLTSLLVL